MAQWTQLGTLFTISQTHFSFWPHVRSIACLSFDFNKKTELNCSKIKSFSNQNIIFFIHIQLNSNLFMSYYWMFPFFHARLLCFCPFLLRSLTHSNLLYKHLTPFSLPLSPSLLPPLSPSSALSFSFSHRVLFIIVPKVSRHFYFNVVAMAFLIFHRVSSIAF